MIKAFVQDIEDVPEALRDMYETAEGGHRLRVEGMIAESEVSGLKSALEKEKERRRGYSEKLQKLGAIDPDEFKRLKEADAARAQRDAEKKGEWDKLKAQLIEQHNAEKKQFEAGIDAMRGSLERYLIEAEATREISARDGVPELLLPAVKNRVRVVEENGEYRTVVMDEHGDPMISDSQGTPMTIGQLVDTLKGSEVYGRAFGPMGKQGVGTPANAQRGTGPARGIDPSKLSPTDKIRAGLDGQQ